MDPILLWVVLSNSKACDCGQIRFTELHEASEAGNEDRVTTLLSSEAAVNVIDTVRRLTMCM